MATEVLAPMQGRVLELLLEPGDEVDEDEPVLILEAMKMKVSVGAPADGVLTEYLVGVGDDVEADDRLAVIGE
jgi:biotin carboxyl carrier protein